MNLPFHSAFLVVATILFFLEAVHRSEDRPIAMGLAFATAAQLV